MQKKEIGGAVQRGIHTFCWYPGYCRERDWGQGTCGEADGLRAQQKHFHSGAVGGEPHPAAAAQHVPHIEPAEWPVQATPSPQISGKISRNSANVQDGLSRQPHTHRSQARFPEILRIAAHLGSGSMFRMIRFTVRSSFIYSHYIFAVHLCIPPPPSVGAHVACLPLLMEQTRSSNYEQ
jgi:hypothetical protein